MILPGDYQEISLKHKIFKKNFVMTSDIFQMFHESIIIIIYSSPNTMKSVEKYHRVYILNF